MYPNLIPPPFSTSGYPPPPHSTSYIQLSKYFINGLLSYDVSPSYVEEALVNTFKYLACNLTPSCLDNLYDVNDLYESCSSVGNSKL